MCGGVDTRWPTFAAVPCQKFRQLALSILAASIVTDETRTAGKPPDIPAVSDYFPELSTFFFQVAIAASILNETQRNSARTLITSTTMSLFILYQFLRILAEKQARYCEIPSKIEKQTCTTSHTKSAYENYVISGLISYPSRVLFR